jgi:hypothetical protein
MYIDTGLNRFMNGMVVLSATTAGGAWFSLVKKKSEKGLLFLPIILTIYFSVISGSRQSILCIGFILIFYIFTTEKFYYRKIGFRVISILRALFVIIVSFGFIALVVHRKVSNYTWVKERLSSFLFVEGLSHSDESRLMAIKEGINFAFSNNGFGIGPGRFSEMVGMASHNGYVGFLAEIGIIFGTISLIIVISLLIWQWYFNAEKTRVGSLAWIVFFATALIMANLNDLFREPIFWVYVGLAIGFSIPKREALMPFRKNE